MHSLPLAAGIGDVVAFLVFIGFLVVRGLAERKKAAPPRPRAPRPSSPPPTGPEPQAGGYSWRDLLEGRAPEPPRADPPPSEPPLEAWTVEPRAPDTPTETPRRAAVPASRVSSRETLEDRWHEHRGPMVPEGVLGPAPSEDELERHGGDRARPLLDEVTAARLAPEHSWRSDLGISEAGRPRRSRRLRGGWRAAVVNAELLGAPVALRPPAQNDALVSSRGLSPS